MIYLLLAIMCSAMLSIIMRLSQRHIGNDLSMLGFNYITCVILSIIASGVGNLLPREDGISMTLGLGVLNGFLYLAGFVLLQVNIKRNGVVMSTTFMKLGLLVPMIFSLIVFGERMNLIQSIGTALALSAIILINSQKEETNISFKLGLILLLLANGGANGMSKVYDEVGNEALSPQFLLYTFAMACLLCWALAVYKKEKLSKYHVLYGVVIGVPNFFSAKFLLKSVQTLPAVIAYPTFSVGAIIVVSLVSICFFKEKLDKRQWIAIAAILVALALLNI